MSENSTADLTGTTAIVTGASRGFGAAITLALTGAGARVIGVARTAGPLQELHQQLGERFTPVVADAAEPEVAPDLLRAHRPTVLVLNAGATPPMAPLHELSWDEFSRNWQMDTRQAFHWAGAALRAPLPPGSVVVVVSSGAALRGSPLSGGYAGAKSTVKFISLYAAAESARLALGIRFLTLLPQLTPATALGAAGSAGYAARQGVTLEAFVEGLAPILTPEQVGREVLALVAAPDGPAHAEYLLTGRGAQVLA